MKKWMFALALSLCFSVVFGQETAQIKQVLETQRQAWNRGDLIGFMDSYWSSDSLVFIGKNGPKYGWKTTLENYQKSYPDKAAMGILTFDIKEVRLINGQNAFVLGAWHLKIDNDEPQGFFTLFMRKIKGKWLIVADHSS